MVDVQEDANVPAEGVDQPETDFPAVLDRAATFAEAVHGAVASLHPPAASLSSDAGIDGLASAPDGDGELPEHRSSACVSATPRSAPTSSCAACWRRGRISTS